MPAVCPHFQHLATRHRELIAKFLADQVADESANPATFQPDLDRLAAFRLLLHAEIETFLEAKAKDGVRALEDSMKSGKWQRSNPQALSLYILAGNPIAALEGVGETELRMHFSNVIGSARKRIKENNGIKNEGFVFLSVCGGKCLDEVDPTLAAALNSYGKERGEVAHGSAVRSSSILAPSAERMNGAGLVHGLSSYFDVIE